MSDYRLVKEVQIHNGGVSKEDLGASHRQTDSKNGLFAERSTEHPVPQHFPYLAYAAESEST
jgi:hypothetical protein